MDKQCPDCNGWSFTDNRLMSRQKWIENRVESILMAMEKYRHSKYIIPVVWAEELAEHLNTLDKYRKKK